MSALSYLLDGLEAEFLLERELGVFTFDCDRALLASLVSPADSPAASSVASSAAPSAASSVASQPAPPAVPVAPVSAPSPVVREHIVEPPPSPRPVEVSSDQTFDFVFLHHVPLSSAELEIITKGAEALGKTSETAPLVLDLPLPKAKVYIVLGGLALKKFFPGVVAGPGDWKKGAKGEHVAVTYSPVFFRRFQGADLVLKKRELWRTLKIVVQRIQSSIV